MVSFAIFIALLVVPVRLVMQITRDSEGFGLRYVLTASAALSIAFAATVLLGGVAEGLSINFSFGDTLMAFVTLLPATFPGGLAGRAAGWLLMRIAARLAIH